MGGEVNIIVREKDGNIFKMCRWTNSLKSYFHSPEFVKDPDSLLKKYIKAGGYTQADIDTLNFGSRAGTH